MKKFNLAMYRGIEKVHDSYTKQEFVDSYLLLSHRKSQYIFNHQLEETNNDDFYDEMFYNVIENEKFMIFCGTISEFQNKFNSIKHPRSLFLGTPSWIGRSILGKDESELIEKIEILSDLLKKFQIKDFSDLYFKLSSIIPCHDPVMNSGSWIPQIYGLVVEPYTSNVKIYDIFANHKRTKILINTSNSEMFGYMFDFEIIYKHRENDAKSINLKIYAFNEAVLSNFELVNSPSELFPPYVFFKSESENEIISYIKKIVNKTTAISESQLLCKLSIFTNTLIENSEYYDKINRDCSIGINVNYNDCRQIS